VGLAEPRPEAAVPGEVEEAGVEAVQPAPVAVPLGHDGAHVVVQHLARHAAEGEEGVLVTRQQRLQPLVGDELGVGRAAPAQRRHEHRQPLRPAPDGRPVHLHLLAGRGLEARHGLGRQRRSEPRHVLLEDAVAAPIAPLAQLPQQRHRRQPLRRGRRDALRDVRLEAVQLARPRRPCPVPRHPRVAQVATHRVPRNARLARDLPHALAVLGQHPDLQRQLSPKHPGPRRHDGEP
jgi:hypothetical protein